MGRDISSTDKARYDAAMVVTHGDRDALTVPCTWCGITLDVVGGDVERDRVIPGGGYNLSNLQPACRECNGSRGDATTGEWSDAYRILPLGKLRTDPAVAHRVRVARGERRADRIGDAAARRAAHRATLA